MTTELEKRVDKWFKPDPDNKYFYMKTIDPKNEILGKRGWGGSELNGYGAALRINGKVLLFVSLLGNHKRCKW